MIGAEQAASQVAEGCAVGVSIQRAKPEDQLPPLVTRDALSSGAAMQRVPEAQRGSHPPGRQVIERDEDAERRGGRRIAEQPDRQQWGPDDAVQAVTRLARRVHRRQGSRRAWRE